MKNKSKTTKERTITRDTLAKALKRDCKLSLKQSSKLTDDFFSVIRGFLVEKKRVKIRHLGSFFLRHKAERMGRNPRTKEEAVIPARDVVIFRTSSSLRNELKKHKFDKNKKVAGIADKNYSQEVLASTRIEPETMIGGKK